MGLPVRKFVAATNRNRVITDYIQTGIYETKSSVTTASNAMDVGAPSNYERLMYLYGGDPEQIRADIESFSFSDENTIQAIRDVYRQTSYLLDPHEAVILRCVNFLTTTMRNSAQVVVYFLKRPIRKNLPDQ